MALRDDLRATFVKLKTEIAAVEAKTSPIRAARDKLLQKISLELAEIKKLEKQFMQIEKDYKLFDLKQDYAVCARAIARQ